MDRRSEDHYTLSVTRHREDLTCIQNVLNALTTVMLAKNPRTGAYPEYDKGHWGRDGPLGR
jgi:hypothetical protein